MEIKLAHFTDLRDIIMKNKLKNITIITGKKNIYNDKKNKFIVTKDFLSKANDVFRNCHSLETINMKKFDFSEVISLKQWFCDCVNLQEILFPQEADCSKLTSLYACFMKTNLQTIDLSFMKIGNNSLHLKYTFADSKAQKIILPKANVKNFESCFSGSLNVVEIIAPITLDMSETLLHRTFYKCNYLKRLVFTNERFDVDNFSKMVKETASYIPTECCVLLSRGTQWIK